MNDRDCENCKHHKEVCKDGIFYHSCESWNCEFEPKEDAISRKELDKALYERFHEEDTNNITDVSLGAVRSFVRNFPSVNPQKPICPSAGIDCEDCPAYEPKVLNKWIGAEVLDRIRNEMHATAEKHEDGVYYMRDEWVDEIIDKYAEGSGEE